MKNILSAFLLLFAFASYGQKERVDSSFIKDFTKALDHGLTRKALYEMINKHSRVLHLRTNYKQPLNLPLNNFKKEKLYTNNINSLLNSENPNQRTWAYIVIAATGDTSFKEVLLGRLRSETEEDNLFWGRWCLKVLSSKQVIEFDDYLVNDVDIPSAPDQPIQFQFKEDAITSFVMENKLDSLQDIFEKIYTTNKNQNWKNSAIWYLSTYPKERHKMIFREILSNENEKFLVRHNAAMGLGRLKDTGSVDLIISVSRSKRKKSDSHAKLFLEALRVNPWSNAFVKSFIKLESTLSFCP